MKAHKGAVLARNYGALLKHDSAPVGAVLGNCVLCWMDEGIAEHLQLNGIGKTRALTATDLQQRTQRHPHTEAMMRCVDKRASAPAMQQSISDAQSLGCQQATLSWCGGRVSLKHGNSGFLT